MYGRGKKKQRNNTSVCRNSRVLLSGKIHLGKLDTWLLCLKKKKRCHSRGGGHLDDRTSACPLGLPHFEGALRNRITDRTVQFPQVECAEAWFFKSLCRKKAYVDNKEVSEGKCTTGDQAEALGGGPGQGAWASAGGLREGASPFDPH